MGIKILAGRGGSGKTNELMQSAKNRLAEGRKTVLIVPEQYSFQAERDLMERLDRPGLFDAEVLSFSRLVHRILEAEGGLGQAHISDLGKTMLLRKVFEDRKDAFSIFGGAFNKQGFISKLNGFINELKKNGIIPEELVLAASDMEGLEMLQGKLRDIAFAYGSMEKSLEKNYADAWDLYLLAEEKLMDSERYSETAFFVDGFAGFTGREKGIICALAKKSEQLVIAISCDRGGEGDSHVFTNTRRTLAELQRLAEEEKIGLEINYIEERRGKDELSFIRDNFYRYPTRSFAGKPDKIQLFSARNRYSEVENAAGEILRLVDEKGFRFRDVGILCDMSIYGDAIRRVFSDYDIPCFIDRKRAIAGSALARYVISALESIKRNYRYEDVFAFLKTGLTDMEADTVQKLENFVLSRGIRGSLWNRSIDTENVDFGPELEEARSALCNRFDKLSRDMSESEKIEDYVRAIDGFLDTGNVADKIEAFVEELMEKGELEYASEYAQIWNIIMEIFGQLIEVGGDEKTDLSTFIEILRAGIDAYEVGIIPTTIDQVLVGGLKRTRAHNVKALFIVGINDRVIPSAVEDAGIMLDEEIRIMQKKGLPVTMDGDSRVDEEKFAIYSAICRPSEYLWFSYALSDSEGQSLRPSILASRLHQIFPELEETDDHMGPRMERVERAPKAAYGHMVETLRLHIEEGRPLTDEEKAMACWFRESSDFEETYNMTAKALFHDNSAWNLKPDTAKQLYGIPLRSSSSRIEKYYQCPFQHFVSYGLRPSERKVYELKSPDVGRIFHESVEVFTKKVAESGLDWHKLTKGEVDNLMGEAAREIMDGFDGKILGSTERYKYFADRIERVAKKAANMAAEHVKKGDFEPLSAEIAFGEGKSIPPIVIETNGGDTIRLEGRIDRMDLCEQGGISYVKVIDYKSYDKPFKIGDAYYGLQIQLPVYMNAAMKNAEAGGRVVVPAGAFYFKIDDPMIEDTGMSIQEIAKAVRGRFKMKGLVLKDEKVIRLMDRDLEVSRPSEIVPAKLKQDSTPAKVAGSIEREDFDNLLEYVLHAVGEAAGRIQEGVIEASPFRKGTEKACTWCEFASICQFDKDLDGSRYRNLNSLTETEALDLIRESLENADGNRGEEGENRG